MMALGTYEHSIDSKGRLFIPVKLRDESTSKDGKFILTQGLEQCLYVYDVPTFHSNLASKLNALPIKDQQDARAFKRLLLAGAHEAILDDMGRLLIARPLIEFAGLKKEVSILGVGERIELWSTPKWLAYNRQASTRFQKLGKILAI